MSAFLFKSEEFDGLYMPWRISRRAASPAILALTSRNSLNSPQISTAQPWYYSPHDPRRIRQVIGTFYLRFHRLWITRFSHKVRQDSYLSDQEVWPLNVYPVPWHLMPQLDRNSYISWEVVTRGTDSSWINKLSNMLTFWRRGVG